MSQVSVTVENVLNETNVTVENEVVSVLVTVSPEEAARAFALQAEAAAAAADVSEFNAAASAAAALASENAAELAEDNAAASASTATAQAGIATTQAGIATTQAGIATTQASAALASQNAAAASASAALGSQNAAAASASTATAQANIATTQAGNALASANAAAASAAAAAQVGTSTLLTGLSIGPNQAITATDSILTAFGEVQAQINARAVISGTPVAGQVAVWGSASAVAGNANLFWNNSTGSLGVGTNSPLAKLEVRDAIDVALRVVRTGTSTLQLGVSTTSSDISSSNSHPLTFTVGSERVRIPASGNVLINTTTDAGFRLDVNGTARVQGALTTNLTATRIPFIGTAGVLTDDAGLVWDNTSKRLTVTSNQTGAASATFRIDNSGTFSNQAALEFYTSTSDAATSFRGGRIYNVFDGGGFANARVTVQTMQAGNALLDTISFKNGLVGVRTNDPTATLHVNGTTLLNGLQTFQGTTASDTAPLGSELATTGSGTNWTGSGFATGYTHVVGSTASLTTALAAVNGTYYQITYTITGRTAGSITINYGGTSTAGITATGATGPLATSTANLEIVPTTDFDGTVVLSVRTIGNSSATTSFNTSAANLRMEIRVTTAIENSLIGTSAGRRITTGIENTFFGFVAGLNTTTGSFNIFIGRGSGQNNTVGSSNTFIGRNSGTSNTMGLNNTAVGANSFLLNVSGAGNVSLGVSAGRFLADGGSSLTVADNSIFLGAESRANGNNQTNQIVIGHTAIGLGSNTSVIGNTSTTHGRWFGNLLIGTSTNVASSALTIESTTRGVLFPRMTSTQRNAIASPATGLVVYNTTDNRLSVYNGTAWVNIATL